MSRRRDIRQRRFTSSVVFFQFHSRLILGSRASGCLLQSPSFFQSFPLQAPTSFTTFFTDLCSKSYPNGPPSLMVCGTYYFFFCRYNSLQSPPPLSLAFFFGSFPWGRIPSRSLPEPVYMTVILLTPAVLFCSFCFSPLVNVNFPNWLPAAATARPYLC